MKKLIDIDFEKSLKKLQRTIKSDKTKMVLSNQKEGISINQGHQQKCGLNPNFSFMQK